MSIPTDRLREIADGAMGIGAPLVLTQAEQVEVCTELLALRDATSLPGYTRLVDERDAARAELAALRGRDAEPFDWDGVPTVEEWIAENLREREPRAGSAMVELHPDEVVADRGESRRVAGWLKDLLAELAAVKRQRDELVDIAGEVVGAISEVVPHEPLDELSPIFQMETKRHHWEYVVDCRDRLEKALAAEQPKPADITLPAYGIDHTGKVVKLVAAEQQKSQPVSRNQMLLDFAQDWTLDGDLLRCRECKRACIASREDEEFVHRSDCKKRRTGAMPWKALVAILMQQPTPQGGA